jgi:hypothetical protein
MGVVKSGKNEPIILGAEPILVTGKIKEGDFLITSSKKGHAKALGTLNLTGYRGRIIAQALEDFSGETGTIKAMINKL